MTAFLGLERGQCFLKFPLFFFERPQRFPRLAYTLPPRFDRPLGSLTLGEKCLGLCRDSRALFFDSAQIFSEMTLLLRRKTRFDCGL